MVGSIMAVGADVTNTNLLVIFVNDFRLPGRDVVGAVEAAAAPFRLILMNALAMILGMLPMILAIGEGSEQSAPLGSDLIGWFLLARLMTL
jgi:multidrug efflux pump subunit AcrB